MNNLSEQRRESADQALASYNFSKFVEDVGEWEVNGDVWTIMVYFTEETNGYFTVRFIPETSDVVDVRDYPLDVSNQ